MFCLELREVVLESLAPNGVRVFGVVMVFGVGEVVVVFLPYVFVEGSFLLFRPFLCFDVVVVSWWRFGNRLVLLFESVDAYS